MLHSRSRLMNLQQCLAETQRWLRHFRGFAGRKRYVEINNSYTRGGVPALCE
jgi:hypothetical protein